MCCCYCYCLLYWGSNNLSLSYHINLPYSKPTSSSTLTHSFLRQFYHFFVVVFFYLYYFFFPFCQKHCFVPWKIVSTYLCCYAVVLCCSFPFHTNLQCLILPVTKKKSKSSIVEIQPPFTHTSYHPLTHPPTTAITYTHCF